MLRKSDEVNGRELRFVGMSRSGNHAVINWALQQMRGRICFLNCVEPGTNPFQTARPTGDDGVAHLSSYKIDLAEEARGRHSRKDFLLYSYEDCYLGMVASEQFEEQRERWLGSSAERRDVLVLRDPFNLFASRSKSGLYEEREREGAPNLVTRSLAMRIWKQHAREFLRPGRYLPCRPVVINYNRWASEPAYRRELAGELALPFSDEGIEVVPRTAGGRSFDGTAYDGAAGSMQVLHRWRHYEDDPAFWSGFDAQLVAYSEEIFGPAPAPLRRLRNAAGLDSGADESRITATG